MKDAALALHDGGGSAHAALHDRAPGKHTLTQSIPPRTHAVARDATAVAPTKRVDLDGLPDPFDFSLGADHGKAVARVGATTRTASSHSEQTEHAAGDHDRDANIDRILRACREQGVTSPLAQAAILAIVSKESNFRPRSEASYRNTKAARIKELFAGARAHSDEEIDVIKKDDATFWEMVYGHETKKGKELGNTEAGDGGTYRGRGYNQVTGRSAYKKYGNMFDVDLIAHPDLLNTDLELAAKVLVAFLKTGIATLIKKGRLEADYGATDVNGFTDLTMAVYAFYNCNAGSGKSFATIKKDSTGGLKKALANAPKLLTEIQQR